jgi:hypothetical protein
MKTCRRCKRPFADVLRSGTISILFLLLSSLAGAQTPALTENQIKAGFLLNFAKFVEWPADAFADPTSPLVLGIVGGDLIGDLLLQAASGKTVNGRAVVLKRFKDDQNLTGCNILFVGASEEKRISQILEKLKGSSVLTVGESDGFAQVGGVINFFIDHNKVRLEINLDAATRARLRISAKVIAVGRLVTDNPSRGKS